VSFTLRAEDDLDQFDSRPGESLEKFLDRVLGKYEIQLNDAEIFQVWDGPGILGFVNKAGDFEYCSCSISSVSRGGCVCGGFDKVQKR